MTLMGDVSREVQSRSGKVRGASEGSAPPNPRRDSHPSKDSLPPAFPHPKLIAMAPALCAITFQPTGLFPDLGVPQPKHTQPAKA